jgi:DNA-binding LacI/PurR family transcriptional regulator
MVTIRDVAKACGFSTTTVSFVLNNSRMARSLPETTKAHVRQTAGELGYRPNALVKSPRSKQSKILGAIVFDITDPYCTQVLYGIQNALRQAGSYVAMIIDIQSNRARFKQYARMLLDRQVEGLIALANPFVREDELHEILKDVAVPVVIVGREMKKAPLSSISTDNAEGGALALQHLCELGHRRIAFVRGPRTFVDSGERWGGIIECAARFGLALDRMLIVDLKREQSYYEGGYELTRQLLEQGQGFTALLAYDDLTAFGAITALNQAGVGVPSGCSVVGFDDMPACSYYNPPLTTVSQTMDRLGSLGVEMLLEKIRNAKEEKQNVGSHLMLKPKLVIRASTAQPGKRF